MRTIKVFAFPNDIPLLPNTKIVCRDGFSRNADYIRVKSFSRSAKSVEIAFKDTSTYGNVLVASITKRVSLLGLNTSDSGVATVNIDGFHYPIGEWKEVSA